MELIKHIIKSIWVYRLQHLFLAMAYCFYCFYCGCWVPLLWGHFDNCYRNLQPH